MSFICFTCFSRLFFKIFFLKLTWTRELCKLLSSFSDKEIEIFKMSFVSLVDCFQNIHLLSSPWLEDQLSIIFIGMVVVPSWSFFSQRYSSLKFMILLTFQPIYGWMIYIHDISSTKYVGFFPDGQNHMVMMVEN